MNYEKLVEVNSKLNKTDIKGKNYTEVNERIKAFWQLFPNGRIKTELLSNVDGVCIFRAFAYENKDDTLPLASGTAYEKESSSFINKTSYIENCETSALGRCLGILGIGSDTSIASAEEVDNAIYQQNTKIDKTKVEALKKSIENAEIEEEIVKKVLADFEVSKLEDIKIVDYMEIVKAFKSLKEAK